MRWEPEQGKCQIGKETYDISVPGRGESRLLVGLGGDRWNVSVLLFSTVVDIGILIHVVTSAPVQGGGSEVGVDVTDIFVESAVVYKISYLQSSNRTAVSSDKLCVLVNHFIGRSCPCRSASCEECLWVHGG